MLSPRDILWGIVFPAVATLVALALAHLPRGARKERAAHPWGVPLALAIGFTSAFSVIAARPAFPPAQAEGWLPFAAIVAAVVGVIAAIFRTGKTRGAITMILSLAALVALPFLLARPLQLRPEPNQYAATALVAGGVFVAWWLAMEFLAHRVRGAAVPFLLAGVCGGAALVLVNAHTQTLGQLAGAVAVALTVVAAMALWLRNLSLTGGGMLAVALLLLGLLVCGHLYADLTIRDGAIVAAAPLMMWAGEIVPARKRWLRFGVRVVAVTAVLLIAVVPAAKGIQETMQEQMDSFGY